MNSIITIPIDWIIEVSIALGLFIGFIFGFVVVIFKK